jgi:tetratricopeptide (TPR) repeat protein
MSSRRRIRVAVLLFSLSLMLLDQLWTTHAQSTVPQAPPKTRVTIDNPRTPKEKVTDYSQEAFVIEQLKTSYRFEKDGTGQRDMNIRVRVQSEAGLERFGQLVFGYSAANEKLDLEFVRVRKADGTAVSASESDVQDLSAPVAREAPIYTDLRQKHVTVPGLRPGDVLEYRAVWHLHTALAPNHFWLAHDFVTADVIVLDEGLEVNIPRDSKVKLKTEAGFEPSINEQAERRVYNWKHANLKRDESDDKEKEKRIDESDEPKPPQVQMTTFQSWDEVGQWYAELERSRIAPDEKIRAKAEELVRGRTTEKDKIEALYEFVAKNFRYVSLSLGQGRYQPHAASEVFANEYGDCKDKHTLFSSMLIASGLRAYPALMNSSRKIDTDVPSPAQFDHVISAIPLAAETLWADTTAEVAPFRLLSPQLRDKKALLIPSSGLAHLETTPAEPPFLSSEVVTIEGQVSDLGKLSAHSHLTLRGDSEMLFRILFRKTPKSNWKALGRYLSMIGGVGGNVTEIKTGEPSALEKPFEIEYDVSRDDFLDWSSKKLKLELPMPSFHLAQGYAGKQESPKPIQLGPPIDITYRLKLSLPSKYQTRLPLPLSVSRDYADYRSSYKLEANTLVVERTLHVRRHELPAERLQDYQAFVAAARADEAQTLALETDVAGAPAVPDSVKVEELIQAAKVAMKNNNFPLTEELLKRVLEKDPKQKEVRRELGYALFAQRKYGAAIDVLREQTKINPFDDYCYTLMGRIFWQQQQYSEAEASFRKQLEVTPLDQFTHANLGQMLVEWRKYKEAVPELESAISLNPEGELLYITLGRAYLNLGEKQKGIDAFDKAVKLAPGPHVWNDVAYFLAVSNVQLEKAQQYAESATTAVATNLRNLELERLTLEDLENVSSLGAYWDTLGWVYFQKGDLGMAEKYIAAAWAMEQHSEVGYHLGQIAEKRGKTQEAIRLYALAAIANRLVPEARESLDRLAGKDKSEALITKARGDSSTVNTVQLGSLLPDIKATIEGEFYVVFVPGTSRNAQVADVRFIHGDEKLKPLAAQLKTATFNFVFPDTAPTKVVRRGALLCLPKPGSCSFFMVQPDLITSVD